ncbi:hypothetical protein A7982_13616 [Minicystis rosea]|nr:hypothetical protein A7982_13616 [Minicystis rosea]
MFDFFALKEVFTWKARAESDDERRPKHEELVDQYRRWAQHAIVNGDPDAWKRFEKQIWADHLCFVFQRPSGVGLNGADALWIGLDGKPLVATMSIPREPGNIRGQALGDVIVYEWLHSVDAYLQAYFGRDEESVVSCQGYDKATVKCSGISAEIEILRQIPDPRTQAR